MAEGRRTSPAGTGVVSVVVDENSALLGFATGKVAGVTGLETISVAGVVIGVVGTTGGASLVPEEKRATFAVVLF